MLIKKTLKNNAQMGKTIKEKIVDFAKELGFPLLGVAHSSHLSELSERLHHWIEAGYFGDMHYLNREARLRLDPAYLLPTAKSVISLAMPYLYTHPGSTPPSENTLYGRVSVYAWGSDYHNVIRKKLNRLTQFIQEQYPKKHLQVRSFVDATPLLERAFAERAGLGFIGKNTSLITLEYGAWVFLAELLVNIELEPDLNIFADCSDCNRCVKACPTGALLEPYVLDARRCISYHTIENRNNPIPDTVKEKMGNWVFGCDVCHIACPYNTYVVKTQESAFLPKPFLKDGWLSLRTILEFRSEKEFKSFFAGSPIRRVGWRGLQRNAAIVAGNLNARSLRPLLLSLRRDTRDIPMLTDAIDYALDKL
ncbi:tRNA epoxyqueuosine(34) reductase QueG [Candidatus Sumerlaeota bacterium]|nr:tRNA epoxyqueuosine(34) reductase QueG [Candidatus Sumerlaeota bacterium]